MKEKIKDCLMLYGGLAVVLYKEEVDDYTKGIIDEAISENNATYGIDLPNTYGEEALDYFIDSLIDAGKLFFNQKWTGEHALKNVKLYVEQVRKYLNED